MREARGLHLSDVAAHADRQCAGRLLRPDRQMGEDGRGPADRAQGGGRNKRARFPPAAANGHTGTVYDYKRDARGNALGGIRLAEFSVATSLSTRDNTGNSFCRLYGRYEPFPDDVINQLYPDARGIYVDAVKKQTDANVKAGYIQAADGREPRRGRNFLHRLGDPCKTACRAAQDLEDSTYSSSASTRTWRRWAPMCRRSRGRSPSPTAQGQAEPTAQAAVKGLDAYIAKIEAMEKSKAITAVSSKELVTAANAVKAAVSAK